MKKNMNNDPRYKYPVPPFPKQYQKYPGLNQKMRPVPDCGETSYVGHKKLLGLKALVTGGDSGIGRAVAIAFAREGASVVITYLPEEEEDANEVMTLLHSEGHEIHGAVGDLKDENFCVDVVETIVRKFGGLDVLANIAGRQTTYESITDIPTHIFDEVFKTNVYAAFWLCREAVKHMKPGASIINTISTQAFHPSHNLLEYSSTKGALNTFTKCLAKQLSPKGIRVNGVGPGPVWTPLPVSGGYTRKAVLTYGYEAPLGRPAQPTEISHLYVLLASQDASYVSGSVWGVDGGKGQTL